MNTFKKILFITLALLPIMSLCIYAVANMGNTEGVPFMPMGSVDFIEQEGTIAVQTAPNTLSGEILSPFFPNGQAEGIFGTFARLLLQLENSIGLPINAATVLTVVYALYIAFVQLVFSLVELITFIPRKCSEIFR